MLLNKKNIKGISEYIIKTFVFYYNNYCLVYQDAKYSISYQPQEPKLNKLKGTKKENLLQEIDQDLITTFNKILAKAIL